MIFIIINDKTILENFNSFTLFQLTMIQPFQGFNI
jgi:hypothetical protein